MDCRSSRSAGTSCPAGSPWRGSRVSYYLRASKTYDTLLQMGRWFGYRPGYEDLCRLYTTPALRDAYVEITAANDELRREFEEMAALDAKPQDFGLRVRTSPAGLEITAREQDAPRTKVKLSYSGDMPETVTFDLRRQPPSRQLRAAGATSPARLDATCPPSRTSDRQRRLDRSPRRGDHRRFPRPDYRGRQQGPRVRPAFIAEYIRQCQRVGELGNWTVRLVSSRRLASLRRSGRTRSA